MIEAILFTLGGLWRLIDGSSKRPDLYPGYINIGLLILLCLLSAYMAVNNTIMLFIAAGITAISILDGFKDWTDFGYMAMRYTGYAALATYVADGHWYYILCGFIAGMVYPTFAWLSKHAEFPKFWIIDGYESYARMIAGALMIGGLSLL